MTKKIKKPLPLTREEQILKAKKDFYDFSRVSAVAIPPPTFSFSVGDKAQVGNLENCIVRELLDDGKALLIEHTIISTRENSNPTETTFGVWWWFDALPLKANESAKIFTRPEYRGREITSSLDSIFSMFGSDGIVFNTRYQRGYVWNDEDRARLLDSIFNRMSIGSFIFVRNHGYLHDNDPTVITDYVNMLGERISIAKKHNYTIEVIDGQQRLTTLLKFVMGQFTYHGYKFSELNYLDRYTISGTPVSYRIIEEQDITEVELLEMFLNTNAGVPQDPAHLSRIKATYEALKH
jgi:hypothetical protein